MHSKSITRLIPANNRDSLDSLPPHSIEFEEALVGLCLEIPATNIPRCKSKFDGVGADVFYHEPCREILDAVLAMDREGEPIDIATVADRLKLRGKLEGVGGLTYLNK